MKEDHILIIKAQYGAQTHVHEWDSITLTPEELDTLLIEHGCVARKQNPLLFVPTSNGNARILFNANP